MLGSVVRAALRKPQCTPNPFSSFHFNQFLFFSTKSNLSKPNKSDPNRKSNVQHSAVADDRDPTLSDEGVMRARRLAEDGKDPSLDVGPNGRPLFTPAASLSQLSRKDACTYFRFRFFWASFFFYKLEFL